MTLSTPSPHTPSHALKATGTTAPLRHALLLAATALLPLPSLAAEPTKAPTASTPIDTAPKKFGYTIGVDLARTLAQVKGDVDFAAVYQGMEDVRLGRPLALTDAEQEQVKRESSEAIRQRQAGEQATAGAANEKAGRDFLAQNANKPGVATTASGLQYRRERPGNGVRPTAGSTVSVNYRGTLIDGTVFDSSYDRGAPATFPLAGVIAGWTEGVPLMDVGSKYTLFVPPELAYGERGAAPVVGPKAVLVFEIELLSVQ